MRNDVFQSLLKRFDHVGMAVKDVDRALATYCDILGAKKTIYKQMGTTADYTFTQVSLGGQTIEMIEPIEGKESFLTKFLKERGEGLHHLTFQVYNIVDAIQYLKKEGVRIVDEFLEKDPLWQTAFISPKSSNGVLIQLYETQAGSQYDHG
jgi:methylmalonyl-CoA/ethylmalonyl-CoA epimerase